MAQARHVQPPALCLARSSVMLELSPAGTSLRCSVLMQLSPSEALTKRVGLNCKELRSLNAPVLVENPPCPAVREWAVAPSPSAWFWRVVVSPL